MRTVFQSIQAVSAAANAQGLLRSPLHVSGRKGKFITVDNTVLLNFACNDYLGLSVCPTLQTTVANCSAQYHVGAASSRLVTGHLAEIAESEARLAEFFGYDECMLMPSGYQANQAVIQALDVHEHAFCYDKRIHASMGRALAAANSPRVGYAHSNFEQLEKKLLQIDSENQPIVFTESLFSMDGDTLEVRALAELKKRRKVFTVVDEAHAFGVLGEKGRGVGGGIADIAIGTLGKAYGLFGAFILMPGGFSEFFCNAASPVMFSTAVSPVHAACALAAVKQASVMEREREHVRKLSLAMREALHAEGMQVYGDAHILAVEVGSEEKAVCIATDMREDGLLIFPARYPTVPRNRAILRISITALHSYKDILHCVACLAKHVHVAG